jgi:mRNA interferase MazF
VTVGDICWIDLPPRGGHAQSGRRPAIVVQTQATSGRVPTVLVVPLTTQLDALRFPGAVLLEADSQNELRRASVALVFQLTSIDRRYLSDRLGAASTKTLNEIWLAFDEITGRQ